MTKKIDKKKIKKVFLVYKRSVYDKYVSQEPHKPLRKLYKKKDKLVKSVRESHQEHKSSLQKIKSILKKYDFDFETSTRHTVPSFKGYDLIITVGGDGTFLRTTHMIDNQFIMGVNSSPSQSVGALCSISIKDFEKKIIEVKERRYKVRKWPRMEIRINKKRIPILATNDILFTNISPAAMSRYVIQVGRQKEEHKSSGIWIATATGSSAAIHAAGGLKVPKTDKRLQYVVREPYQGMFNPYRFIRGFVPKDKALKFRTKMVHSKIYLDGPTNSYDLNYGDEVAFKLSKKLLQVIV